MKEHISALNKTLKTILKHALFLERFLFSATFYRLLQIIQKETEHGPFFFSLSIFENLLL